MIMDYVGMQVLSILRSSSFILMIFDTIITLSTLLHSHVIYGNNLR